MQCFKLFVNLKQKHSTSHHRNRQEPNLQNWQCSHLPRQFQEVPFVVQIQNLEKWCGTVYLSLNVQFPYNLITGNSKNCTYTNAILHDLFTNGKLSKTWQHVHKKEEPKLKVKFERSTIYCAVPSFRFQHNIPRWWCQFSWVNLMDKRARIVVPKMNMSYMYIHTTTTPPPPSVRHCVLRLCCKHLNRASSLW